jgi:hypothetical protein
MKITLESTTKLVELNGVPARIWEGLTEAGVPIVAFVTRVAVHENRPAAEHEVLRRELQECRAPSIDVEAIPHRLVL